MWVELNEYDAALIIRAIGPGEISDRLTSKAHRDAEMFREAANVDDYTTLPNDAPVERTRNGAYVLCWRWVNNEDAGFMALSDFDEYEIEDSTRDKIEALREFQLWFIYTGLDCDYDCFGGGAIDENQWKLSVAGDGLKFAIFENDESEVELWSYSNDYPDLNLSVDIAFKFIVRAVNEYRSTTRPVGNRRIGSSKA